jgi:hypothetical protein
MKTIELTQGKVALVDEKFYESLCAYRWYAYCDGRQWYAATQIKGSDGRWLMTRMHRLVRDLAGEPIAIRVDHRDGNGLNNQIDNLRAADAKTNGYNRLPNRNSRSGYKGVSYVSQSRKWMAQIVADKKRRFLGEFSSPEEAAVAYNAAAHTLHGEFARLNVIPE